MLADQFNAGLRVARVHVAHESAQTLLFGLERVLVVWLAARMVLAGGFTVGMLFAYMAYKELFSQRVGALVDTASELAMLRLHGERVADIALAQAEAGEAPAAIEVDLGRRPARIELRGVGYRYGPTEPWVLRGVDLVVEAGAEPGHHRALGLRQDDAGQGDAGPAARPPRARCCSTARPSTGSGCRTTAR